MMRLQFDSSPRTRLAGAFVLALAQLAVVACDKMPLGAPSGSTVTVRSAATVLPTGGSTEVTAYVSEDGGTPAQNGTMVRFSTNLGRVLPEETLTRNGLAVTTFMAGDVAGEAVVRAASGSINVAGNDDAPNAARIRVGAAAVDSLTVRAVPQFVPFEGGDVQVVATVLGPLNRPLAGIPVTFGATEGVLTDTLVVTDGNGEARTMLSVKPVQGVSTVTVTARAGTQSNTVVISRRPAPAIPKVSLTATLGTITSFGQPVTFTALVTDTDDQTRVVRYEFDFGDGASQSGTSNVATHFYTTFGQVQVARVRVTLFNGTTIEATLEVLIPPAPVPTPVPGA